MTNLITQLRDAAEPRNATNIVPWTGEEGLFRRAADEIEQVRYDLQCEKLAADAEIKRLRSGVRRILSMSVTAGYDGGHSGIEQLCNELLGDSAHEPRAPTSEE